MEEQHTSTPSITPEQYDVLMKFDFIAGNEVFWNLIFLQNVLCDNPNKETSKNELLQFSSIYSSLLSQYYEKEVGQILKERLNLFYHSFVDYMETYNSDPGSQCRHYEEEWTDASNALAEEFARLNPYWNTLEWEGILSQKRRILQSAADAQFNKRYSEFASSFNQFSNVSFEMSRYLSVSIIRQFSI